jgi:hypothetical protein
MITFSVAMMVMVPNAIIAWKGRSVDIQVSGGLFVVTGLIDLIMASIIFGPM